MPKSKPPTNIPRLVIVAIQPPWAPVTPNSEMIDDIEKAKNMTFKSSVHDATIAATNARLLFLSKDMHILLNRSSQTTFIN